MGIGVATGAVQTVPVVNDRWLRAELRGFLVAIGAGHRKVSAGEHEASFLVLRQRECRRLVSLEIMAAIAGIEIGRGGKLRGMSVGVAVCAAIEPYLEQGFLPFGNMALSTLQARVSALKRIRTLSMFFHREGGWLPSIDRVARSALNSSRTLGELAIVWIGFVAIHTLLEGQRLLEISIGMALRAPHGDVFAFQRELRLRVVEVLVQRLGRNLLPTAGVVAGLTGLPGEAPAVRILVAVGALIKRDSGVLRLTIRAVDVALGTLHLGV